VIDPLRAFVDSYVADAERLGVTLRSAIDTHVHADHVSGVRELAAASGATPVVPAEAVARGVDYDVDYDTVVAPGHYSDAATPAEDGTYTARLGDLADAMGALSMTREAFVEFILADMPPRPSNHEAIIATNLGRRETDDGEAFELELGPNNCAATQTAMGD
jgi:glyoxylase-like metal-dependent hydrolase (beta-lactamase superfamily II)